MQITMTPWTIYPFSGDKLTVLTSRPTYTHPKSWGRLGVAIIIWDHYSDCSFCCGLRSDLMICKDTCIVYDYAWHWMPFIMRSSVAKKHTIHSNSWHSTKKPVTTMLTYPWKCTVLHCNHLGNTWKPLVLMTRHFDYCPSASKGDNQSVRSSAPVVSRCFPGGYNVKLYIFRGRLAWWLLTFLHSAWITSIVWQPPW